MTSLELGIIGNGTVAALVDENGQCGWLCLPRLDGEPVFNSLVGGAGAFRIALTGQVAARQRYVRNTAVLETELEAEDGSVVRITDFAPRFMDRGRMFRPPRRCARSRRCGACRASRSHSPPPPTRGQPRCLPGAAFPM